MCFANKIIYISLQTGSDHFIVNIRFHISNYTCYNMLPWYLKNLNDVGII